MLRLRHHRNYNATYATQTVRDVLAASREEAARLAHAKVEPEHILLGLARAGGEALMERLHGVRMTAQDLTEAAQATLLPRAARRSAAEDLRLSAATKTVLDTAKEEAATLGDSAVDARHLLLGVLRADDRPAVKELRDRGITRKILTSRAAKQDPAPFRVHVDDAASTSIYEQIVAQITEAIATGALMPGARLPPIRQLADELDVAPRTVARAYSRLEEQGIVVTEGVRGTRVAELPTQPDLVGAAPENLAGLLRPAAVAAFHLGASASALREALEHAMRGIFPEKEGGHE